MGLHIVMALSWYCILYSILSFCVFSLAFGWVVICNKLIPVVFSSNSRYLVALVIENKGRTPCGFVNTSMWLN